MKTLKLCLYINNWLLEVNVLSERRLSQLRRTIVEFLYRGRSGRQLGGIGSKKKISLPSC